MFTGGKSNYEQLFCLNNVHASSNWVNHLCNSIICSPTLTIPYIFVEAFFPHLDHVSSLYHSRLQFHSFITILVSRYSHAAFQKVNFHLCICLIKNCNIEIMCSTLFQYFISATLLVFSFTPGYISDINCFFIFLFQESISQTQINKDRETIQPDKSPNLKN